MILYFSGTGNSLYIAKKLAELLDDRIVSIAELVCKEQYRLSVDKDENIGFCLGCVNVCLTRALQVGNKSQGNPQYINPHYNGKAREQA